MYTEQNRSILIIKSESADLSAAEAFIVKRDWNVRSCTNLSDSILYIAREHPQFIFISVDHPNRNIIAFIRLLLQTFPERVIVFGEKPHVLTYHHFNETGCRYNIYPPVSGPAIERVLLSYYKNQLSTSPAKILAQPAISTFNKLQKNEAWIFKNARARKADLILTPAKAQEMFSLIQEVPLGKVKSSAQPLPTTAAAKTSSPATEKNPEQIVSAVNPSDEFTLDNSSKAKPFHKHESLISRAAQEALQKTAQAAHSREIEKIEISSDMSCIIVQSTRFSGYLVAALGNNREVDNEFIHTLRKRIFTFLKDNGEQINESDEPLRLTIQKVDFKNWAEQEAEFLRKSVHYQGEVSIAFFPRPQIRLPIEDSADEKMAKIKMAELKADVPVEFDLYIHLEENNRYVRYTKKGSKFLNTQKERLENQGLQHMHVFKEDLPAVNKYRAQNFLNENIDNYHSLLEA